MKLDNAKGALQQGNAIKGSIFRCEICGGLHWTAKCQAIEAHAAHQNQLYYQPQQGDQQAAQRPHPLMEQLQQFMAKMEGRWNNQNASIKNLQNQVEQLAKGIAGRESGSLPKNAE